MGGFLSFLPDYVAEHAAENPPLATTFSTSLYNPSLNIQ